MGQQVAAIGVAAGVAAAAGVAVCPLAATAVGRLTAPHR